MFDVGWSELLVIAVVTIIVIGPKDLPAMMRTFGKTLGKLRAMSNDFRNQFDEAMNAQNLKQDLDALRAELHNLKTINPLTDMRDQLDREVKALDEKKQAPDTQQEQHHSVSSHPVALEKIEKPEQTDKIDKTEYPEKPEKGV